MPNYPQHRRKGLERLIYGPQVTPEDSIIEKENSGIGAGKNFKKSAKESRNMAATPAPPSAPNPDKPDNSLAEAGIDSGLTGTTGMQGASSADESVGTTDGYKASKKKIKDPNRVKYLSPSTYFSKDEAKPSESKGVDPGAAYDRATKKPTNPDGSEMTRDEYIRTMQMKQDKRRYEANSPRATKEREDNWEEDTNIHSVGGNDNDSIGDTPTKVGRSLSDAGNEMIRQNRRG